MSDVACFLRRCADFFFFFLTGRNVANQIRVARINFERLFKVNARIGKILVFKRTFTRGVKHLCVKIGRRRFLFLFLELGKNSYLFKSFGVCRLKLKTDFIVKQCAVNIKAGPMFFTELVELIAVCQIKVRQIVGLVNLKRLFKNFLRFCNLVLFNVGNGFLDKRRGVFWFDVERVLDIFKRLNCAADVVVHRAYHCVGLFRCRVVLDFDYLFIFIKRFFVMFLLCVNSR